MPHADRAARFDWRPGPASIRAWRRHTLRFPALDAQTSPSRRTVCRRRFPDGPRASRARWRPISSYQIASLNPNEIGSPWMPWERPTMTVALCSQRLRLQHVQQSVESLQDEIHRFRHLDRQRGVDDVRGGQPHMEKPMLRPDGIHERFQKRNHVVLRDAVRSPRFARRRFWPFCGFSRPCLAAPGRPVRRRRTPAVPLPTKSHTCAWRSQMAFISGRVYRSITLLLLLQTDFSGCRPLLLQARLGRQRLVQNAVHKFRRFVVTETLRELDGLDPSSPLPALPASRAVRTGRPAKYFDPQSACGRSSSWWRILLITASRSFLLFEHALHQLLGECFRVIAGGELLPEFLQLEAGLAVNSC